MLLMPRSCRSATYCIFYLSSIDKIAVKCMNILLRDVELSLISMIAAMLTLGIVRMCGYLLAVHHPYCSAIAVHCKPDKDIATLRL